MFPQNNPQSGAEALNTVNPMFQQYNSLIGAPQTQTSSFVQGFPNLQNNTAPASSTTNPVTLGMVKALKGL